MKNFISLTVSMLYLTVSIYSQNSETYDYLINKHYSHSLTNQEKRALADSARGRRLYHFSNDIAQEYINSIPPSELLRMENLRFILKYTTTRNDRGLMLFIQQPNKVDSLFNYPDLAELTASEIIAQDTGFINSTLFPAPKWKVFYLILKEKYGINIADRVLAITKSNYFKSREDWKNFTLAHNDFFTKYKRGFYRFDGDLNNAGWAIFTHCDNTPYLNMALRWMASIIHNPNPDFNYVFLDTYSNLLYKLGRVDEAIIFEKKALEESKSDKEIAEVLRKMEVGEKTW